MRCLLSREKMTLEREIYIYVRLKAKSLESKHRQCIRSKKGVFLRAVWVAAARETGQKPEQAAGKAKDDGEEDWHSYCSGYFRPWIQGKAPSATTKHATQTSLKTDMLAGLIHSKIISPRFCLSSSGTHLAQRSVIMGVLIPGEY